MATQWARWARCARATGRPRAGYRASTTGGAGALHVTAESVDAETREDTAAEQRSHHDGDDEYHRGRTPLRRSSGKLRRPLPRPAVAWLQRRTVRRLMGRCGRPRRLRRRLEWWQAHGIVALVTMEPSRQDAPATTRGGSTLLPLATRPQRRNATRTGRRARRHSPPARLRRRRTRSRRWQSHP